MAHAHNLGDGLHGQATLIGRSDGFVSLLAERFASLLQGRFALGVVLGEGGQMGSGLGSMAFGAGDPGIV